MVHPVKIGMLAIWLPQNLLGGEKPIHIYSKATSGAFKTQVKVGTFSKYFKNQCTSMSILETSALQPQ